MKLGMRNSAQAIFFIYYVTPHSSMLERGCVLRIVTQSCHDIDEPRNSKSRLVYVSRLDVIVGKSWRNLLTFPSSKKHKRFRTISIVTCAHLFYECLSMETHQLMYQIYLMVQLRYERCSIISKKKKVSASRINYVFFHGSTWWPSAMLAFRPISVEESTSQSAHSIKSGLIGFY